MCDTFYTMETISSPPWAELPADVVDQVRPHLPAVVDEVIAAVGREVPAYRRPLEGDFGRGLRFGVEAALGRFLDLPEHVSAGGQRRRPRRLRGARARRAARRAHASRRCSPPTGWAPGWRSGALPSSPATPGSTPTRSCRSRSRRSPTSTSCPRRASRASPPSSRLGPASTTGCAPSCSRSILGGSADPAAVQDAARAAGWALPDLIVPVFVSPGRSDGLSASLGPEALVAPTAEGVVALLPAPARPAQWARAAAAARRPGCRRRAGRALGRGRRGAAAGDPRHATRRRRACSTTTR